MKSPDATPIAMKYGLGAIAAGLAIAICSGAEPDPAPVPATKSATRPAAQVVPDDLASIQKSFADLANSDFSVRSQALTQLMSLSADALPTLRKAVEESKPLLPAQAVVLRKIVGQIFLSGEMYDGNPAQGFLGIHMEEVTLNFGDVPPAERIGQSSGVVVLDQMPGFPGARMFRDGDVILSIFDRPDVPLNTPREFATAVSGMGAGAIIQFQVLRQGRVIRVPVKLDPRPVEADLFTVEEFLSRRRVRADRYWFTHFAALVKDGVS